MTLHPNRPLRWIAMRRALRLLPIFVLCSGPAHAICNVIPAATIDFRSAIGSTNRPYASPGEPIEVRVDPTSCDASSTGFVDLGGNPGATDDYAVTVVFTPPNGTANAVVLAEDCTGIDLSACSAELSGGNAVCRTVNDVNNPGALAVISDGELQFDFPDTDDLSGAAGDGRTLSGPAKIVVTRRNDPLQCQVATTRCADTGGGLIACADEFYPRDGTCRTDANLRSGTFAHFTALPNPNDFESMVSAPANTNVRLTTDTDGNVLVPMNYSRILLRSGNVPIPQIGRLETSVAAFIGGSVPPSLPDNAFVASYSPGGIILPPVFRPLTDPSDPTKLVQFGSIDAPLGVIRMVRQGCLGGSDEGAICTQDSECSSGTCSASIFEFRDRYADGGVGPVILPAGLYSAVIEQPVPLDGLVESEDTFAFVLSEPLDGVERNGDADNTDTAVVTLRDASTGLIVPIGPGGAEGRAVPRIRDNEFAYPAVEAEGNLVVFLESEVLQDNTDFNGNGALADTVLRAFRFDPGAGATELTSPLSPPTADALPAIAGRSIAISGNDVFFLTPESRTAQQVTERVSVDSFGAEGMGQSYNPTLSEDGTMVSFISEAPNLIANDVNGVIPDAFIHDRVTGATEVVSIDASGQQAGSTSFGAFLSDDGRQVAMMHRGNLAADVNGDGFGVFQWFVRDRLTGVTKRISLDSNGVGQAGQARGFHGMSEDGSVIAFQSQLTLVPDDTNGNLDAFVHDRDADADGILDEQAQPGGISTERISVDSNGNQAVGAGNNSGSEQVSGPNGMSADGRYVAFTSVAGSQLDPNTPNSGRQVFVRDRLTQSTRIVSVSDAGVAASNATVRFTAMSEDGRYVMFPSRSGNLVPGTGTGNWIFVRDLERGRTRLVSADNFGAPVNTRYLAMSDDGRFAAFASDDIDVVAADTNGVQDVFVRDVLTGTTERVSLAIDGSEANGGSVVAGHGTISAEQLWISGDGRTVAFASNATNLVPGDTNFDGINANSGEDVFVRGPDLGDLAADLSGDGDVLDTVLRVLDGSAAGTAAITTLCPATQVALSDGSAAFLRPEAAGVSTSPDCSGAALSGPDLNGDLDATDEVIHFWDGNAVTNLRCAATEVALSSGHATALVSESGEGADLNLDGDQLDDVVHARDLTAAAPADCGDASWLNTGQAAETHALAAGAIAFLTAESAQGVDLNGDTDTADTVLQIAAAASAALIPITTPGGGASAPLAAEDFVMSDTIVAFRTLESAQGQGDLNGDGDTNDGVLHVYDLLTGEVHSSGQAVTPCTLLACDPRFPYRTRQDTVRFLTLESEQGADLNDDGDQSDLLIQLFNVRSGDVRVIAEVFDNGATTESALLGVDPLASDDEAPGSPGPTSSGSGVLVSAGRCMETSTACSNGDSSQCAAGELCFSDGGSSFLCGLERATCAVDADCPFGSSCFADPIVIGVVDTDLDEIPEGLDNCPDLANVDQSDMDADGVGDVCDLETCGNGSLELNEQCDDGNTQDGDGCSSFCAIEASPITIDIKPFSPANIVIASGASPIFVSVLGSPTVDVFDIDETSLTFGPAGASPKPSLANFFFYWLATQDINGDGYVDLTPNFFYGDTGLPFGESQACLSGEMNGVPFTACDTVNVLSPSSNCGLGPELVPVLAILVGVHRRRQRTLRDA